MIAQLKEIVSETKKQNQLLLEQNKLLKSGKLQVVVVAVETAPQPKATDRRGNR
jgi:hypothetical protein